MTVMLLAAPAAGSRAPASERRPPGREVLTVGGPTDRTIAPGFLGLSLEYWAIPAYAGSSASAVDPVFVQLIRNLTPGYAPVLRIGGVTTDNSWWPAPGLRSPRRHDLSAHA